MFAHHNRQTLSTHTRLGLLAIALLTTGMSLGVTSAQANGAGMMPPNVTGLAPELWNWWQNPYNNQNRAFEIDYQGNQTGIIPAQVTGDDFTNAFAALQDWDGTPVSATTVNYDSGAQLTRVVLSSTGSLPASVPANPVWPGPNWNGDTYHLGINAGWTAGGQTLPAPSSYHWLTADGGTTEISALHVRWDGKFKKGKPEKWAAIYIETANQSAGGWGLIPYQDGGHICCIKVLIDNVGTQTARVGNAGYILGLSPPQDDDCIKSPQCAANQAALDQLNDKYYPVPGSPGSPFKPMKAPAKDIPPGGSIVVKLRY